jgi:melibiose permease/lactose/raffinose/galactose permease
MANQVIKNRIFYGLGTIGRDIYYSFVTGYLIAYLTEVLRVSKVIMGIFGIVFTLLRIFDAVNDPISGWIVDKTKNKKLGKFKYWQLIGMIFGVIFSFFLFFQFPINDYPNSPFFVVVFIVSYLGFDFFYGLNDTAYWGMLPALSTDTKNRNADTTVARICANIGSFSAAVLIVPITLAFSKLFGDVPDEGAGSSGNSSGWLLFYLIVVLLLFIFQLFPIIFVKEKKDLTDESQNISIKDMFRAIFKNKQLLIMAICMLLYMSGYLLVVGLGLYYSKYIYGDANFYSIFALILGISQLISIAFVPLILKFITRRTLFTIGSIMSIVGFALFLIPTNAVPLIAVFGVIAFSGNGFINVLTYAYIQDTVEYGQLLTGKRSEAITVSVQSFINKGSAAIGGTGLVTLVILLANIVVDDADDIIIILTDTDKWVFKIGMFGVPLLFFGVALFIFLKFFKLNEKNHAQIVKKLEEIENSKKPGIVSEIIEPFDILTDPIKKDNE